MRASSVPSTCPDGVLDGQIYTRSGDPSFPPFLFHHADSYFVCNRYEDGKSYGEMRSCKFGDVYISVGRRVGQYECTSQGLRMNEGSTTTSVFTFLYPLRGQSSPSVKVEPSRYGEFVDVHTRRTEKFKKLVKKAKAALGLKQVAQLKQKTADSVSNLEDNEDCDELTEDCYFTSKGPGIVYPAQPGTDIDHTTVDPANPDCDPITQDCYFTNVPKEGEEGPAEPVNVQTGSTPNPDCDPLTEECYFTNVPDDIAELFKPEPNIRAPGNYRYEPALEVRKSDIPTCMYNGVQAKAGQKFVIGDLYVLECRQIGVAGTEIRRLGCLERQARHRGQKKFPGTDLYFYSHSPDKSKTFQCDGKAVPGKINVV